MPYVFSNMEYCDMRFVYGFRDDNASAAVEEYQRLVVFTAVTMKNGVFWDVTPCGSCKNRRFGGT
jgi:hypothetical protein